LKASTRPRLRRKEGEGKCPNPPESDRYGGRGAETRLPASIPGRKKKGETKEKRRVGGIERRLRRSGKPSGRVKTSRGEKKAEGPELSAKKKKKEKLGQ